VKELLPKVKVYISTKFIPRCPEVAKPTRANGHAPNLPNVNDFACPLAQACLLQVLFMLA
jgi:hypothetical protein